jgi:hypothetical protein
MLFFEVDVAFQWGITPDVYLEKASFIKALMGAYIVAKSKMGRIGN